MEPIVRKAIVNIGCTVAGSAVWCKSTITETIILETGDSTTQVVVEELANMKDGQMLHPRTLTAGEFRDLVSKIRRHETYL